MCEVNFLLDVKNTPKCTVKCILTQWIVIGITLLIVTCMSGCCGQLQIAVDVNICIFREKLSPWRIFWDKRAQNNGLSINTTSVWSLQVHQGLSSTTIGLPTSKRRATPARLKPQGSPQTITWEPLICSTG